MNISQAARLSGLTSKTLRYYESIQLLTPGRAANGYREYSRQHVDILQFIHRARASGFSIDEVRELLQLYSNPARRSHDAKLLVQEKLQQIKQQLVSLKEMQKSLVKLYDSCAGDDSPECGILDQLANGD